MLTKSDLVTFTEEILNGKLHFLCSDYYCTNVYEDKYGEKEISEQQGKF